MTVDGKPYRVEVSDCQIGAPFSVKVNDKPVEVALENELGYKEAFTVKVHGKAYTVELTKIDRQAPFSVKVNNTPFKVELKSPAKQMLTPLSSKVSVFVQRPVRRVFEEGVVTAPMAGKIISVRVRKGDSVKVGDVVCTLEAMKMENEVSAPRSGVVQEVAVREGMAVNADDVLVVIK